MQLLKNRLTRTNEYNRKVFAADKANYYSNRAYEWETTLRNYKYNQGFKTINYLQTARQYQSSVENTQQQLLYNSMAAMEAQESEQASLNEILKKMPFNVKACWLSSCKSKVKQH